MSVGTCGCRTGRSPWARSGPPAQFAERDNRLALITDLWNGGYGPDEDLGPSPVRWNAFKQYASRLANFLLLSEPMVAGEVPDAADLEVVPTPGEVNTLADVCHDALIDLAGYGGTVLMRFGDEAVAVGPATWYPHVDGTDILARTWTDGEDGEENRLDITVIDSVMTTGETVTYEYDGHTIGKVLVSEDLDDVEIEVVARNPRRGIWGTSKFIEMYPLVYEVARRLSRNSRIFDLYSGPIPVFTESELDAETRFGVPSTDTDAERERAILEGQVGILAEDSIHLPDNIQKISYLQPNVQGTSYALVQVHDLREMLRDITGLPDLSGQTLSGEALKRLYVHFYAETAPMQDSLRLALERLLGVLIDWLHAFDSGLFVDAAAAAPADPEPAMGVPTLEVVE